MRVVDKVFVVTLNNRCVLAGNECFCHGWCSLYVCYVCVCVNEVIVV